MEKSDGSNGPTSMGKGDPQFLSGAMAPKGTYQKTDKSGGFPKSAIKNYSGQEVHEDSHLPPKLYQYPQKASRNPGSPDGVVPNPD